MMFPPRPTASAATLAAAAASVLAYPFLPRRIATHFNARNRPDRYSPRAIATLSGPVVMAGVAMLNNRLGTWPGARDREDVESGVRARDEAIGLCALAVLLNHLAVLANALGLAIDLNRVQRGVFGVMIIALGNLMPKLPRNGLVGIRTPWTLADAAVWERTHRVAGYLCVIAGLISLATLPATGKRAERIPKLALLTAAGLSVAYSGVASMRHTH